jgi:hypothetical protein
MGCFYLYIIIYFFIIYFLSIIYSFSIGINPYTVIFFYLSFYLF